MDCTDICIRNWYIDTVLLYCIAMWIYLINVSESDLSKQLIWSDPINLQLYLLIHWLTHWQLWITLQMNLSDLLNAYCNLVSSL